MTLGLSIMAFAFLVHAICHRLGMRTGFEREMDKAWAEIDAELAKAKTEQP